MTGRKDIFKMLQENYDIENEFRKIVNLFSSRIVLSNGICKTIEELVNLSFNEWEARGSCVSCENMKEELGLKGVIYKTANTNKPEVRNQILNHLEYYINVIFFFLQNCYNDNVYSCDPTHYLTSNFYILKENILTLLDHLNHEVYNIEEKERCIIIPKNAEATAVAEITSNDETALAILMYNHRTLKGNLEAKRRLLANIALEYEVLLDSNPKNNNFSDFYKQTRGLLNSLHIRHNNKEEENNKNYKNLPNEELEKWYDETYQMLLFCVLAKDNSERKIKVTEFLKSIKQK